MREEPKVDSIVPPKLAKWLSTLAQHVLLSCMSACVGVGAISDETHSLITRESWVLFGPRVRNTQSPGAKVVLFSLNRPSNMWGCHIKQRVWWMPWLTGSTSLLWSVLSSNTSPVCGSTSATSKEVFSLRQEVRYPSLSPEHKGGIELREAATLVLELAGP